MCAQCLIQDTQERLILNALSSLLRHGEKTDSNALLAGEFLAIRRLVASKASMDRDGTILI